ncbi:hypothetical protein GCM10010841_30140 [Deinococcus aerophilus]|uniref:Uncharacterized protein n=1 Tax=Deinococcus aerophilus TaxID=522488 RepID=A0ABQ2GYI5_9DEIO|nr:hypothetical protein GCM10010841_30140 [Deinococcus aerophilus]
MSSTPPFWSTARHNQCLILPILTQFPGQEGRKPDVPLPDGFVTDDDAALVKQFLDVPVARWEAVVQPNDAQGKTAAVRLAVSHDSIT